MQEEKKKFALRIIEITLLTILTPIICFSVFFLLMAGNEFNYPHRYLYFYLRGLSFFVVLGFDVVWIILMRLWPLKSIRLKIILTWAVLTLSAIVLVDLYGIHVFQNMW
jgi:hypothetical protein